MLLSILAVISLIVVSISISTSSASASAMATSVVLMIGVALLISSLIAVVIASTVATLVLVGADTHQSRNNLFCLSVLFALSFLLLFFLGYPHFYQNGFDGTKEVLVVKSLDCLLSVCYSVIKNVGILRCDNRLTESLGWLAQLKRNDVALVTKGEKISQALFIDITRNELNINVWVECLSQTLSSRVNITATLVQFAFSFADVKVDNEELSFRYNFFVHCLNSSLGVSWIFEANVSVVLSFSLSVLLNLSRFDGAKLSEKFLQFSIISTLGQIFDE